jgi:hypothetical protein
MAWAQWPKRIPPATDRMSQEAISVSMATSVNQYAQHVTSIVEAAAGTVKGIENLQPHFHFRTAAPGGRRW